jgi:glutamyl/glutaminyl-tRNA synthetase
VKNDGYVVLPKNKFNIEKVDTFQYRNYTLIKDGILNLSKLPVKLNPVTLSKLNGKVTIENVDENGVMTINFAQIPVINRSMVKDISAKKLGELEYDLIRLQANKKVYDYYDKLLFPRQSEGLIAKYGKEGEEFLKGLGITDYNGFSPKTELVESTDFYYAVRLETKISGYSSLPKVSDVEAKLLKDDNAVLKPTELLLAGAIRDYLTQINSDMYKSQDDATKEKMISNWLKASRDKFNVKRKEVMQDIAKIKFSLILSKKWFKEFKNFDDNALDIDLDGKSINVKFVMEEEMVKI